jgi:histidine triad (HIT) family protein
MLSDNVFLKIINKQINANLIHEDEMVLAFHDISPKAPVHVLIIPRKEIRTHDDMTHEDREILGHMHWIARQLAQKLNLGNGYRLVINCKEDGGQTVPHLHMHMLAGRELLWPPG